MTSSVPQSATATPVATPAAAPPMPAARVHRRRYYGDRVYRASLTALAMLLPFLLVTVGLELTISAWPSITKFGFSFLWGSTWDPVAEHYGAAPMIFGTLVSSFIALLIAVPLSLGVAIFLTEFAPRWLRQPVAFLVELLAAIPSVVYGVWGIYVLIPILRSAAVPALRA